MPLIPIDQLESAVEEILTNFRKGVGNFAKNNGEAVRLGEATITFEVVMPGTPITAEEQEASENAWKTKQVQTELSNGAKEVTENTKNGSYTQSGWTLQQQSGGSSEDTEYKYDETA